MTERADDRSEEAKAVWNGRQSTKAATQKQHGRHQFRCSIAHDEQRQKVREIAQDLSSWQRVSRALLESAFLERRVVRLQWPRHAVLDAVVVVHQIANRLV